MERKNIYNNIWVLALILAVGSVVINILLSLIFGFNRALFVVSMILASFFVGYLYTYKSKMLMEKSMRLKISLIFIGFQLMIGLIVALVFGLPKTLIASGSAISIFVVIGFLLISFFSVLIIYMFLGYSSKAFLKSIKHKEWLIFFFILNSINIQQNL
tara:strand:+ start:179 stop:652 length:474 start_codon:yes stop_codon:yes gene_type:complete